MRYSTTAKNLQGNECAVDLTSIPDICPVCKRNVQPKFIVAQYNELRKLCQVIFRCVSQSCQKLFIATYENEHGQTVGNNLKCDFRYLAPKSPTKSKFPKTIKDLSPSFVNIYDQALYAESQNLDQICGIGFRKALEFLIKDFAIHKNPDREDDVKNCFLGKCITDYVEDSNVKECAKRAVWLGNDETHYMRKWIDKDIEDLKRLVKLTVNWIDNVLETEKYISEMENN